MRTPKEKYNRRRFDLSDSSAVSPILFGKSLKSNSNHKKNKC
jgi:hypothetical protein